MRVRVADSLGMCFGVRDAIALAMAAPRRHELTVLGELVHNPLVLRELEAVGIRTVASVETPAPTEQVMITAHGAAEHAISRLRAQGHEVLEATCPLVHVAHRAIKALVRDGYHPVIIGQRTHVEVRGLTEDLDDFHVVLDEDDVQELDGYPRIGVAAQTTQPIDRVTRLVGLIRERFPHSEVRFQDTVCQLTKQRQTAAIELAEQSDVVIVIGGANSNNTRELVATCSKYCS